MMFPVTCSRVSLLLLIGGSSPFVGRRREPNRVVCPVGESVWSPLLRKEVSDDA